MYHGLVDYSQMHAVNHSISVCLFPYLVVCRMVKHVTQQYTQQLKVTRVVLAQNSHTPVDHRVSQAIGRTKEYHACMMLPLPSHKYMYIYTCTCTSIQLANIKIIRHECRYNNEFHPMMCANCKHRPSLIDWINEVVSMSHGHVHVFCMFHHILTCIY